MVYSSFNSSINSLMRRVAIGSSAAGIKLRVDQLHRAVPVVRRPDGLAAVGKDRPIPSASVECYLESKFGENLEAVRPVMEQLACSSPLRELAIHAYHLYEEFRPEIPSGAPDGARQVRSISIGTLGSS
jgi:hypothetical protein